MNPKQITDEKQLIGKTITGFKAGTWESNARIEFSDGTFVFIGTDYSHCYYEGDRPDIVIKEYQ